MPTSATPAWPAPVGLTGSRFKRNNHLTIPGTCYVARYEGLDVLVVGRASDFSDVDPGPTPLSSPAPSAPRCAALGLAERRPGPVVVQGNEIPVPNPKRNEGVTPGTPQ